VTLLLNLLRSRAKLCLVSAFPDTVKDCAKMRNLPKIFLRSLENVGPESALDTSDAARPINHSNKPNNNGLHMPRSFTQLYSCVKDRRIAWNFHTSCASQVIATILPLSTLSRLQIPQQMANKHV